MKILIADDEKRIRTGMSKMITGLNMGVQVVAEAPDGETALTLAREKKPDVIFADLNMPFLNGLDFIEQVKVFLPDVIVVIVTGYDLFEYAQRAVKLHVHDYLLKPVTKQKMEAVLTSVRKLHKVHSPEAPATVSAIVARLMRHIESYYDDPELTLQGVADVFQMSPSYLTRLMRQELDMSFVDYLTEVRLNRAIELMTGEATEVKLYEIAAAVGYTSQHYFSRVFKKKMGVAPLEYKQGRF
ncbi:response regulator transcription factor [Fusibacter sp. JL298sf-3]